MMRLEQTSPARLEQCSPYAQSEEDHELNLSGSFHLETPHDWNRQTEEHDLDDDLRHDRQSQNHDPVDTCCVRSRSEIPYSADWNALEGSESSER